MTAGNQMSMLVNRGIMMGFDYGKNIITGVFQKFGQAIGERIEDEMSDIQSAGGMYALDKKTEDKNKRLFNNFTQARNMQEELNRELAKSAASLPGATSDYVQSAKQLTDTVFGTYTKDEGAFAKLAQGLGAESDAGAKGNITQVLKKFTEQSVLLSQGSKGGMPLGMLLEQLISQDSVNIGAYKKRYKQLRSNPLLANMLEDAQETINASGAMTAGRFKAVMDALDNALPEEVINSMRRSVAGVTESLRSAFMDPEVGLLGLGRPLQQTVASINAFGQYIDEEGRVVQDISQAAQEQTTVFKMFRDIMAGFGGALGEIAQILPMVFDPLEGLAKSLSTLREKAVQFSQMFTGMANTFKDMGLDNSGARAGITAFSRLLADMGGISEDDHRMNVDGMMSGEADFASVVPRLFTQLLGSDFAEMVGSTIGEAIGEVLSMVANLMVGGVTEFGKSGFAKGLAAGWKKAGGSEAIKGIFNTVFSTMGKLLLTAISMFPMETALLALLGLIPALAAGLMAALPAALPGIIGGLGGGGGIAAAIAGGLTAILASPALIAAIVGGLAVTAKATEGARKNLTDSLASSAQKRTDSVRGDDGQLRSLQGNGLAGIMDGIMGELTWVVHDFVKGFGDIFTGLYNIVVGAFTDPKMVGEGITQIMTGLFSLFTMIGHALIAIGYAVPGLIMAVLIAIKNLFVGIGHAIIGAWMGNDWTNKLGNDIRYLFNSMGQAIMNAATAVGDWGAKLAASIGRFFSDMMNAIGNAARSIPLIGGLIPGGDKPTSASYDGNTSRTMSLGSAIGSEMKNKPAGSHLVIANSSETVIPAANGFSPSSGSGGSGAGGNTFNITVNGGGNAAETAEIVAQQIVYAIQKSTYNELYTS